jgi:hypothetical protein
VFVAAMARSTPQKSSRAIYKHVSGQPKGDSGMRFLCFAFESRSGSLKKP